MDGHIFANSLISLKDDHLRIVYAMLCRTNIGNLLVAKTKDIFTKDEQDHFTIHLMNEVQLLKTENDDDLKVLLMLEITKLLKIKGTKYTLRQEIEEQCTLIVQEVYTQYIKQDKNFRQYVESSSGDNSPLQFIIQYQMTLMFRELDKNFGEFTIEDQTKFANAVHEYVQSLPEEKQALIKEKLGLQELSDEMMRKALAASGASLVFAIIVEVSGFAFYTTAASLFATFAGVFGITLPFAFYTGLSSTVAVVANPLFFVPLLLGGGYLLFRHQNQELRKKLLPIIVMQIALPYMSGDEDEIDFTSFIARWSKSYHDYRYYYEQRFRIEQQQKENLMQLAKVNARLEMIRSENYEVVLKGINTKAQIKQKLLASSYTEHNISSRYAAYAQQYKQELHKLSKLHQEKNKKEVNISIFDTIKSKIKKTTLSLDIHDQKKRLTPIADKMVLEVIEAAPDFLALECKLVNECKSKEIQLYREEEQAEREKDILQRRKNELNHQHSNIRSELSKLEKTYYGLADLTIHHSTKQLE